MIRRLLAWLGFGSGEPQERPIEREQISQEHVERDHADQEVREMTERVVAKVDRTQRAVRETLAYDRLLREHRQR